jgi:diguanylate cyclase (GGDEF)-like protein
MVEHQRTALRLGLGIAVPAVLILAGAVAAVLVSLGEMAATVNRTEVDLTARSAEAAVAAAARHMGDTVGDYAHWDDAVRHLYGEPDSTFVGENLGDSTDTAVLFDTVYLVDALGNDVLGYRLGSPAELTSEQASGGLIREMIAELPHDGRTYDVRSGLVDGQSGLMLVAVAPIVPVSADMPVDEGGARFLAIGKAFNAIAVSALGKDYVIRNLTLGPVPPTSEDSVTLRDFSGSPVASLSWTPRQLGSRAQGRIGPLVVAMLGLLAATVLALIGLTVRGVLKLQRKERDARYAAGHDALTGLPNRTALVAQLHDAIAAARNDDRGVAVAYLDLDGFKEVNDAYGHATGDELLRIAADRFREICGERLLVRVGGDEFAVIIEEPDAVTAAVEIGERLVRLFDERIEVDGRTIALGTSVGVVGVDSGDIGVEELLRRADVAMYRAKQLGRSRLCIFEPALDAARARRTTIAAELHDALKSNGLSMVYQPVFDARTGAVVAAEALLRWPRPGKDSVPTLEFVSIAEESGLIDEIGKWTVREACRAAGSWPGIKVAVNVSPAQFSNPEFPAAVAAILAAEKFPADRLEIEVTENFFINHPDQARQVLDGLRRLGVSLALDDFGTGYSSIGYLRRFAFDKVKIDRTLVAGLGHDRIAQDLLQATVHIGRALGLTVTAEGVETEIEAVLLRAAGCHELQGFYLADPMAADALSTRLYAEGELARTA